MQTGPRPIWRRVLKSLENVGGPRRPPREKPLRPQHEPRVTVFGVSLHMRFQPRDLRVNSVGSPKIAWMSGAVTIQPGSAVSASRNRLAASA